MSDFTLDSSSLIEASAFKDNIARTERSLDAVSLRLEELKRQLADPLIEAQRQEANRFKRDVQLRQLGEKTEAAREALDKLRSPQPSPLARLFGLQRTAPPDAAPAASHRAEVY